MDYRTPRHDERLAPCPICGQEPWADSKSGTIYCDCGLRLRINGDCSPEWHRMDWTADEWNGIAKLKEENAKLRQERDHWHVEQVHAYGNWEDAHKRSSELESENAKLRDVARRQHEVIITQYCPEYDSMRCKEECPLYHSKDDCEVTRIMDELEELGVEVDE